MPLEANKNFLGMRNIPRSAGYLKYIHGNHSQTNHKLVSKCYKNQYQTT